MGKTNKQQTGTNQQQQVQTPLNYFTSLVQQGGYSIKTYNQLAECTVQLNGKVQIYFVPLKRTGGLKLCLKSVNGLNLNGLQYQQLTTYPSSYTHRVYIHQLTQQTQQIINTVVNGFTPVTKG